MLSLCLYQIKLIKINSEQERDSVAVPEEGPRGRAHHERRQLAQVSQAGSDRQTQERGRTQQKVTQPDRQTTECERNPYVLQPCAGLLKRLFVCQADTGVWTAQMRAPHTPWALHRVATCQNPLHNRSCKCISSNAAHQRGDDISGLYKSGVRGFAATATTERRTWRTRLSLPFIYSCTKTGSSWCETPPIGCCRHS